MSLHLFIRDAQTDQPFEDNNIVKVCEKITRSNSFLIKL